MTEDTNDIIQTELIKRPRGRPRKDINERKILTSSDRKDYMHNNYSSHYNPKPRIVNPDIKYGRPIKEHKLTEDMSAYQKAYREQRKLKLVLNSMD